MKFNLEFTPEELEHIRFSVYFYERAYFGEVVKAVTAGVEDPVSQKHYSDLIELGARLKSVWLERLTSDS